MKPPKSNISRPITINIYYEQNREQLQVYQQQYREQNSERLLAQKHQYYLDNKDKIMEKHKTKIVCDCGALVSYNHSARHKKSALHLEKSSLSHLS